MPPQVLLSRDLGNVTVQAVQGDITDLDVDAITNAANDHLWMGAGVAGAIKRRGGVAIEREAVAKGPIPVGTCVATSAGDLKTRHVIHAAVMGQDLSTDLVTVRITTRAVVEMALAMSLESLAMPLLGTGVGGMDVAQVASAMAEEIVMASRGADQGGMLVLLVAYDVEAAETLREAVEGLK